MVSLLPFLLEFLLEVVHGFEDLTLLHLEAGVGHVQVPEILGLGVILDMQIALEKRLLPALLSLENLLVLDKVLGLLLYGQVLGEGEKVSLESRLENLLLVVATSEA